jgi:hypothetical protein
VLRVFPPTAYTKVASGYGLTHGLPPGAGVRLTDSPGRYGSGVPSARTSSSGRDGRPALAKMRRPAGSGTLSERGRTVREYVHIEELEQRTPWTREAVKALIRRGVLVRGKHYFQPSGPHGRLIFKWSAVVELIEASGRENAGVVETMRRRRRGPVGIDVEEATARARRLLGR